MRRLIGTLPIPRPNRGRCYRLKPDQYAPPRDRCARSGGLHRVGEEISPRVEIRFVDEPNLRLKNVVSARARVQKMLNARRRDPADAGRRIGCRMNSRTSLNSEYAE
jgi:hypothetical protein